ncbi:hypothetical protein BO83DRAFT_456538 [Aspergillus eucalypticola CBS 122712]|uniref:DUF7580 domain-containing protein n=1 Tax=Aspergillus eucalypticola (strain CBS 122712 / IBT 29274) TaxID=1448314 RepID=A0A317UP36_ASPEC|nr:uncharacterized protein BO83DRAFT_456538 [Aspergillus eucalypticola CBS 122712]PWY63481.1 hypothetical protein BO83DRAFT_456538 [Aspergillus eucalypticola CBS 122712]
MVTGIETASLVLAILPLLLNQLDNYVLAFQRMTHLRSKIYWREMDDYRTILETQKVIFLNTLQIAVDGTIEYEYGDWMSGSPEFWENREVQQKLRQKLGDSYESFTRTLKRLSDLLQNLFEKLGGNAERSFVKQLMKLRHFALQSVYKNLFEQIKSFNSDLKTLVEQSKQIQEMDARRALPNGSLGRHRIGRQLASSLHNAIINGDYWRCLCRDQHSICFTFDCSTSPWSRDSSSQSSPNPKFRLAIGLKIGFMALEAPGRWRDIEAEPDMHSPSQKPFHDSHITSSQRGSVINRSIPNINFAQGSSSTVQGTIIEIQNLSAAHQIVDICTSLSANDINEGKRKLLGYVTDKKHKHKIYHLGSNAESVQNIQLQTLEELIAISSTSPRYYTGARYILDFGMHLQLAVNLACTVFQFEGNWLPRQWRVRDIKIPTDPHAIHLSFVEWNLNSNVRQLQQSQEPAGGPFIYLGIALVELSLCQNLVELQTEEDHDQVQILASRNTALRLLPQVEVRSGYRYRQVVDRCLNWPNCTLDNVDISKAYQSIIAPLMDHLTIFGGEASRLGKLQKRTNT